VTEVSRTRNDLGAMVLTALAVVVLAAADRGWAMPLIGTSHRWAAGAVLLLGWNHSSGGLVPPRNPYFPAPATGDPPMRGACAAGAIASVDVSAVIGKESSWQRWKGPWGAPS
jgi:hypothetical protein